MNYGNPGIFWASIPGGFVTGKLISVDEFIEKVEQDPTADAAYQIEREKEMGKKFTDALEDRPVEDQDHLIVLDATLHFGMRNIGSKYVFVQISSIGAWGFGILKTD